MEKEFVSYEQALVLKELGFDRPCFGYYYTEDKFFNIVIKNSQLDEECSIASPLYQQAFRFFREKYNILLDIVAYYDEKQLPLSKTNLQKPKGYFVWDYYDENFSEDKATTFDTYEEAELECLKKLIEIVKNK